MGHSYFDFDKHKSRVVRANRPESFLYAINKIVFIFTNGRSHQSPCESNAIWFVNVRLVLTSIMLSPV